MHLRKVCAVSIFVICLSGCFERDPTEGLAPVSQGFAQERPAYIVKKGDTLFSIAWKFDKDYKELAYYNKISPYTSLKVGQQIRLVDRSNKTPTQNRQIAKRVVPSYKKNTKTRIVPKKRVASLQRHWYWPAKGKLIKQFSPKHQQKGIDIQGKISSPIYASQQGIVAYSGNGLRGYGNLVIIRHANNYLSAYAQNRKIFVKEGQRVKAKQKIAEMGRGSRHTGVLHFEIRKNGKPINPLKYLARH